MKRFYDPHPGMAGAVIPLPGPFLKAVKELDGQTMTIDEALAILRFIKCDGYESVVNVVSQHDFLGLRLTPINEQIVPTSHGFRLIRFKEVDDMTHSEMFQLALLRPKNFDVLDEAIQWSIDKTLGILDWDGSCSHQDNSMCDDCKKSYREREQDDARTIPLDERNPITPLLQYVCDSGQESVILTLPSGKHVVATPIQKK